MRGGNGVTQQSTMPRPRTVELSEDLKAAIAMMTDTEFHEWFCRYIAFMSNQIAPRSLAVHQRIVKTRVACDGFSFNTASRYHLTSKLHQTSAYQRLFAEQEDVA
jgi:hypothetical protein